MSYENNMDGLDYDSKSGADKNSSKMFFRKRKGCPLCSNGSPEIDYKDPELLGKFISEGGRMLPSRITNVCSKHQRNIKKSIRHSRIIALLPFVFQGK
jgi:small subunit ribosomal protein S18